VTIFANDAINDVASKVPYVASIHNVELDSKPVVVTLTQKLPQVTVTKKLTFYPDGHYDINIKTSKDIRYFVYLGERPHVSKKLMAVAGDMVYTGDDVAHIIEDGKAEGRQVFQDVKLASSFDQYTAIILYGFKKNTNVVVEQGKDDNPTIGILICKSKDNLIVEYALKDINKPIGVSEYKLTKELPKELDFIYQDARIFFKNQ